MTDFRELCAELVDQAIYLGSLPYEEDPDVELMDRASAALAEPEQEGPTDEEIIQTASDAGLCYPVCWDLPENEMQMQYLRGFVRAVLARWGSNTSRKNFDD